MHNSYPTISLPVSVFLLPMGWMLVQATAFLSSDFQFYLGRKTSEQLGQSFVIFPLRNKVKHHSSNKNGNWPRYQMAGFLKGKLETDFTKTFVYNLLLF